MKREIKFRGKDVENDNQWRYGSLIQYPNGCCVIVEFDSDGNELSYDVKPDTVGHYTGLKDKNGKGIYEGDIAKFDDTPYNPYATPYTGRIMMYQGCWCVEYDRYNILEHPRLFRDDFASKKTTVLGNIHDSPELLCVK